MEYTLTTVEFSHVSLTARGNGTDTVLEISLELPPFNLDLKGNLPTSIADASTAVAAVIELSADRKSVIVTFATPPTGPTSVNFSLAFAGQ